MPHEYKNKITWTEDKKGNLTLEDKPSLEISTPEDFGGPRGYLAPEDLFVASINSCIMTTFLYFTGRRNIDIKSYESEAVGKVSKGKSGLFFSEIIVTLHVELKDGNNTQVLSKLIETAKKYCLISNSVKTKIKLIY
jgi:organic hydroperoxide reductase OsmC/OhrA